MDDSQKDDDKVDELINDIGLDEQDDMSTDSEQNLKESTPVTNQEADSADKKTKSNKKWWILIVVLILAVAGGVGCMLVGSVEDSSDSSASSSESSGDQSQSTTKNYLYVQKGTEFTRVDVDANTNQKVYDLPENSTILYVSDDGQTVIYYTIAGLSDSTYDGVGTFYRVDPSGVKQLHVSTALIGAFRETTVISQDNSKVAYWGYTSTGDYTNDILDSKLYVASLDGSDQETVFVEKAYGDGHGPFEPRAFSADGNSVYIQEYSCYQCDGPPRPKVWKAAIDGSTLDVVFDQANESTPAGTVLASPDKSRLVITAQQSFLGAPFSEEVLAPFDVYILNLSDDTSSKVYSKQGENEGRFNILGWHQNSQQVFAQVNTLSNPEGDDITIQSSFDRFDAVNVDGSAASPIPLVLSQLGSGLVQIGSATQLNSTLFFTTNTFTEEATFGDSTLYKLEIGSGESAIETVLSSDSEIKFVGSGQSSQ